VVGGYFGDRLAQMCARYGATVARLDVEWGRACDPDALRQHLKTTPADVVALVHAETSTGVLNPVRELAAIAREQGALTIVDAVTSLGGMPLEIGAWGIDAAYSCTQKCLGGPSGLAPVVFGPRALAGRVKCRSFYFDLSLLEDYWLRRKYHHTMSSTLVYALYEALSIIEEEGLDARWERHERNHRALLDALAGRGLSVLPREGERLWTLNAVRVPDGIDEAAVRAHLLETFNIEIGAGLGPLAGKIWRVGLMGASSSPGLIVLLGGALESALAKQRQRV
jgi:alanine-glyoxylate transaminase/serine-glyoxylate transaminase/serine-pyruvate transaminase